jgi:uncharacterized protein with PIN domain
MKQSWSLGSTVPALCPKCNAEALHRSHAHSSLEEKRKKLSSKRPYRCHECQWRGWLEESQLRYSAAVVKARVVTNEEHDVDIPDIALDDDGRETAARARGADASADTAETQVSAGRQAPAGDRKRGRGRNSGRGLHATGADRKKDAASSDNEDVSNGERLPDFEESETRPLARKVDTGFHHHARHTAKRCPGCGEASLFRSRSRGFNESVKKRFTNKRLYRCHRCGWRGWLNRGF